METQSTLIVHKEAFPFLNISLYLNNIRPVRSLAIENISETDLDSVEVKINSDLPCIEPFNYAIASIPAKRNVEIPLDTLKLKRDFLNRLSETEKAIITIEIVQQNNVLVSELINVDIHPLEQFGGFQILPELIAAYVTPNHPYIYHIKRKAVDILEKQGLKAAFEGYQSNDPERVLQIMSAIYTAIQSEDIVYSSIPPGYEEVGQRLRLLNTIQQEKFANCIDLSLLFAACLEAVDLNPILIIVRGHAFVGCWLQDEKFSEIINDDKTAITKRISKGIREIAAVEATTVCKGSNMLFSNALNMGEAQLVEKEDFLLSVDVKRARTSRIRPLPLLTNVAGTQLDEEALQKEDIAIMEKRFEIGTIYQDELTQSNQPKTKQKIWERKLLDLSLRNSLLNLRMTRNMLQLVDIDINHLEDTLSEGKTFSIQPNPNVEILRKYNLFTQPLHQSSPLYQMANDELKYNRLLTHYHPQDLDNILPYIHKNAKLAIEENGSSTLYLAVGLLKWYDRKTPEQPRYAPILLLPVEIGRRSVNSKFTLKSREEETLINITLIEFLRQEYELDLSTLEQLPLDDKGVDVAKVMGILRRAVMHLKGWDVEEQLVLGNFSFSKLILWKDIVVHQEDLLKSDMVKSLIDGKLAFYDNSETTAEMDLDSMQSQSLTLPIPTDVSQMEAVLTAQKGHSFILHGPPGTGKSQTITNIIADALYHGKRVLFVAAKKAALDVVYRRLGQIGLTHFALELHSNKSKKSDVLDQLAKSIEFAKIARTINYEQESQRLDVAKKGISDYVNILHKKQPIGWSLYESISAWENYSDADFSKDVIPETVLLQLDSSLWQQWIDWLPQFQSITRLIIHPDENPLATIQFDQYSTSLNDALASQTLNLLKLLPEVKQSTQAAFSAVYFPFEIETKAEWEQFVQTIQTLDSLPNMSLELACYLSDKENYALYEEWNSCFQKYQTALQGILSEYNRDVLSLDISTIERQWKEAQQTWFLSKWMKTKDIKKKLSVYRNVTFKAHSEVEHLFANHNQMQEAQRFLQQNRFSFVQAALKNLYKEEHTDLADIEQKAVAVKQIREAMNLWGHNALTKWLQLFIDRNILHSDEIKNNNTTIINEFKRISVAFHELEMNYRELAEITYIEEDNWLQEAKMQLQNIQTNLPKLKDWLNYVQICNAGNALQLQWLIDAYENKKCNVEAITDYFHCTTHASIARQIIEKHEILNLFNAELFESKIEQYKKIAKDYQSYTIQELRIKLAAQLPNTTIEAMQSSEIGILQRAIKNRGRGLSIRKLFDQIPTLLPRIAPCILMSPISAAQYFDVDTKHFDLVIFDEASQLPTCEAISALARAKQAVIVGDPNQMPPTSFFTSAKVDEENIEMEDLESILDDCLSLSVPSKYLLRHYRSKHESLIAFSNVNYYENKLLTFPSADDLNRKVQYHQVNGFYDKGKTRTNKFEVEAILQYIKAHYSDTQRRKRSLGVVTFSQAQQNLVEEKLQQLFMEDSQLEQLANECEEPLFIKNLENVQGDERDIILFSVGYAPDEEGKMSMNFGPLNRNGGWRRLNVAVTRARYEMHIFATLKADQIDLSRTSSEGVSGLKAFLQFAEKGQLTIRPENIQAAQTRQSLSEAIGKRLQEKGLIIKSNIGTSEYKVDVGIVHPDKPQQYILGIILDGYYYYNARTCNDREMVMPSVLKTLGWNIFRIWAMDWHDNADKIVDAIVKKVKHLQTQPEVELEPQVAIEPIVAPEIEPIKTTVEEDVSISIATNQQPYIAHILKSIPNANSEMIYDYKHRNRIKQQIQSVVETEAPISKSLLYKKVLQAWNTSRAGARLDKHLEDIINEMNLAQINHYQTFYRTADSNVIPDYYRSNDVEKRNMEDIAPEEIIVALQEVVTNNLSIEEEELLRYLARTFGFAKVGKQIDSILCYTIDLAVKEGKVKRENGRIKIMEV